MSTRRRDDEELMAFLDGELAPREAREAEARLAATPEGKQKSAALAELGDVVRGYYARAAADAEPSMAQAWARLEAALDTPEERRATAGAAREGGGRAPAVEERGFWQRLVDALSPGWTHVGAGLVGAAAAALLFVLAGRGDGGEVHVVKIEVPVPGEAPELPKVMAAVETQVDELEIERGTGMVFQVAAEAADGEEKPATTVIWVTEDPDESQGSPI